MLLTYSEFSGERGMHQFLRYYPISSTRIHSHKDLTPFAPSDQTSIPCSRLDDRSTDLANLSMDGCGARASYALLYGPQRRSLHDNDELDQLRDELRKAYVRKALQAQLAEHEADRLAEKAQARLGSQDARCLVVEEHQVREREELIRRERLTTELLEELGRQVEEKRCRLELQRQEEREERLALEELDRLQEERERAEKLLARQRTYRKLRLGGLVHSEERQLQLELLQALETEERERREAYERQLEARAQRLAELRRQACARRAEAIEAVAKILMARQTERIQRQRLALEKALEEARLQAELEEREAELRRRQRAIQVVQALDEQVRERKESRRRLAEAEQQFAAAVMARLLEAEREERATLELKKRRRVEYRAELETLMTERTKALELEVEKVRALIEEEERHEEQLRKEARNARLALLRGHVDQIAEFVSRRALTDEERALVDAALNNRYGDAADVDPGPEPDEVDEEAPQLS
ncbi:hypothetical protein QAD02_022220 [Eretmocerus hayati]|uniref:Uncharacterized protein n=1 Tax=Eretmocerus hayati TaxID=131215 RepID=A0ACC2PUI2_9HYME|nr:hypothetical protein QAD02_022220 [Eretmocerus hayati]